MLDAECMCEWMLSTRVSGLGMCDGEDVDINIHGRQCRMRPVMTEMCSLYIVCTSVKKIMYGLITNPRDRELWVTKPKRSAQNVNHDCSKGDENERTIVVLQRLKYA